jgi:hypothetical protein
VGKEDLMLARWTNALGATVVAATAASLGLLAASPAHALEGIQGRRAIFTPSLELVYQHDDNFFLTPKDEVSADSFIAHAHFVVEVPGARQFLKFEYAPQYRDVNVNDGEFRRSYPGTPKWNIDSNTSHFWTLDAQLRGSSIFGVDIKQNFMMGVLETHNIDEGRELVDQATETFMRHDIGVDFKWTGSRQGAKIMLGKEDTAFDQKVNAPAWFELDAWRAGMEYHYKFAPLTNFFVGYRYDSATQDYVGDLDSIHPSLDSNRNSLWFGFDGELGRTTTGRAQVGFESLDYTRGRSTAGVHADQSWEGVTARADVTKSFSRWSKLIFNMERMPYYSGFEVVDGPVTGRREINEYYVENRASFTFTNQPQGGRVMWTLIGQFQRNDYDLGTYESDGVTRDREDDITRVRAEIGFHPIQHLSFRLNYQWEERDVNLKDRDYDYEDNMVFFQMQFGF